MTFRNRGATATVGLAVLLGFFGPDTAQAQVGLPESFASFEWHMEPRFGLDADEDGRIEIENTVEYAHNRALGSCSLRCPEPRFQVVLQAGPTATELGLPESFVAYEWRLTGPLGEGVYRRGTPELRVLLPEGETAVDLRVQLRLPFGNITQRKLGRVAIDDLVVVALGDSYASGEGSPDVGIGDGHSELWADSSDPAAEADHAAAHRSAVGWPVQVALGLEDASPYTSITFVDLAVSGARIDRGLLTGRTDPPLPAQVEQLATILQDRPIDILLLQIGGNDVGFSRLIRALVDADPQLDPICYHVMLDNTWAAANDGIWDRDVRVTYRFPFRFGCRATPGTSPVIPGLMGLDSAFTRLATALDRFDPARVVLVEYPDPTGSVTPGVSCKEIVGDVTPPFGFHEVDEQEQAAGIERLLRPLNARLEGIAIRWGWLYVGGVEAGFSSGHGYCAPRPDYGNGTWYRPPGRYGSAMLLNDGSVSWYRTAAQSAELQGPVPRYLTAGTLHPNEQGHLAIARLVLSALSTD